MSTAGEGPPPISLNAEIAWGVDADDPDIMRDTCAVTARTVTLHSDSPGSAAIAWAGRSAPERAGVTLASAAA